MAEEEEGICIRQLSLEARGTEGVERVKVDEEQVSECEKRRKQERPPLLSSSTLSGTTTLLPCCPSVQRAVMQRHYFPFFVQTFLELKGKFLSTLSLSHLASD